MLAINGNFKTMKAGKQVDGPIDASIRGGGEVIVAEEDAAGSQDPVGPVYVRPSGEKVMTRIYFNQITQNPPLTKLLQNRPARKRYGQNRVRKINRHHVLQELLEQQNVAVYHLYVPELVSEPGPAPEVVDAEDLSPEPELAGQVGHVDSRRAEERPDLDDRAGPDAPYEVVEYGTVRAPPLDALRT